MIRSTYRNWSDHTDQVPVTYNIPKPFKKHFNEDDLFKADCKTFGSLIGQLTNHGTSIIALMADNRDDHEKLELLNDRLRMVCAGQSKQIDKAKIGENVKSIPGVWKAHQKINEDDDEETIKQKEFYNSLLSDRKPYFFKHLYKKEKDRYNAYKSRANDRCYREYRITLKELLAMPKDELTNDQNEFIKNFNDNNGFINSNCEMNRLCKYIESIDFDVSQKIRNEENFNPLDLMIDGIEWNESVYKKVRGYTDLVWKDYIDITKKTAINTKKVTELDETLTKKNEWFGQQLKEDLLTKICSNEDELTNYLIKYFFIDRKTVSKSIFWKFFGDSVYKNLLRRNNYIIQFPLSEENNGNIEFLRDVFTIYNVDLREESVE